MYLNEEQSDVKIVCEDDEYPGHKFILSARSDVFRAMFRSNLSENDENGKPSRIQIKDFSSETVNTFLKFMYTDELKIIDINVELLVIADKYNVDRLTKICSEYFSKNINEKNVMAITLAAFLISNDYLLKAASRFIFKNLGNIKKSEAWDSTRIDHPEIVAKVMDLMVFEE